MEIDFAVRLLIDVTKRKDFYFTKLNYEAFDALMTDRRITRVDVFSWFLICVVF